jgi:hypothetical protein
MEPPGHWRIKDNSWIIIYDGPIDQMYRICNEGPSPAYVSYKGSKTDVPAGSCFDAIGNRLTISGTNVAGTYERIPMPKPFKSDWTRKTSKNVKGKLSPSKFPNRAKSVIEPPGHWHTNNHNVTIYNGRIDQMYRICNDGPSIAYVWVDGPATDMPPGSCVDVIGRRITIGSSENAAGTYERIPMPKPIESERHRKASRNAKESLQMKN